MPIKVAFQNINGKAFKVIVPENGALNRILPIGDSSFPLLGWVDPNSNTIFNSNPMWPLLTELDLVARTLGAEEAKTLIQLRDVAVECRDKPQTYLRFIGD